MKIQEEDHDEGTKTLENNNLADSLILGFHPSEM